MTRPHGWVARFVLVFAFAIATSVAAQNTQTTRRRAVNPVDQITILQTTDLHHHANGSGHVGLDVDPSTGMSAIGAYARISAYVNYVRTTAGHPVILVDSGDWTMGTLYDLTLASRPLALYFLSAMRYDCVTLGNHEFDYTPRGLAQMLAAARSSFAFQTPIVASNMSLGGNSDLAPYFGSGKAIQPTFVEQLSNGTKVGFLGLMGEQAAIDAPGSAPVTFAPLSSNYVAIQSIVDDLRNGQGAQVVIALSHSGTNASGTAGEDIELARHVHGIDVIASGHTHTPLSFNNVAMTDASLNSIHTGLKSDAATAGLVAATDQQLNKSLAPLLAQFFADFDAASIGKGIYHPVAVAAQDMVSNDKNPVLSPNGLGDLAADSVRNVPNAINAQTLAAVGGNPANLPGYDFTPYQMGVVATGVLRGTLPAGVPLTFADIYNILPLGISPDSSQLLPIGYPLVSTYIDLTDLKKVCALQLIGQTNLIDSGFYLNISGIRYSLKPAESYAYFKYATAAAVLDITLREQAGGSAAALQALLALFNLGMDQGTALLAANAAGNPYAAAMVKLNDANPDSGQIAANLHAIGEVAAAAIYGTAAVSALVVSKAVAAIDTVAAFAATDTTNTGQPTDLTGTTRIRTAVDLYAVLLINAVQSQFGIAIKPYQAATGSTVLSPADFPTLLANRIDLAPATAGVQELKEWMALLSNVGSGLGGSIGPQYASTPIFTQFGSFGSAVQARNATYPLAAIGQLVGTIASLQQAP